MKAVKTIHTTRVLGEAQGYVALPVVDAVIQETGNPVMVTHWKPSPEQLARLNDGKLVQIMLLGTEHPPIMVDVSEQWFEVVPDQVQ